jgi:hypothetical protein
MPTGDEDDLRERMLDEQLLAQTDPQFGPMHLALARLYEDRLRSLQRASGSVC